MTSAQRCKLLAEADRLLSMLSDSEGSFDRETISEDWVKHDHVDMLWQAHDFIKLVRAVLKRETK